MHVVPAGVHDRDLTAVGVGAGGRARVLQPRGLGDGQPVTDPIVLPGSHKRWQPIATAESWNGGVATCNGFRFRFERVGVAQLGNLGELRRDLVRQVRRNDDAAVRIADDHIADKRIILVI